MAQGNNMTAMCSQQTWLNTNTWQTGSVTALSLNQEKTQTTVTELWQEQYFFKSAFGDNVIKIKDHLSVLIFVNTLKCTC